jgi:hypothetical protein
MSQGVTGGWLVRPSDLEKKIWEPLILAPTIFYGHRTVSHKDDLKVFGFAEAFACVFAGNLGCSDLIFCIRVVCICIPTKKIRMFGQH